MTATRHLLIAVRGWRAWRWQPLLVSWTVSAALIAWWIVDLPDTGAAVAMLRFLGVVLVLGALFILDDTAHQVVAAVPVPLAARTTARLEIAAAGCAAVWLTALALTQERAATGVAGAVSIELGAMLVSGFAAAAAAQRFFDHPEPGEVAGPIVIGVMLGLLLLPEQWAFVVSPGAGWRAAHLRWAGLGVVAAVILLASTRDPATRRAGLRRQGPSAG